MHGRSLEFYYCLFFHAYEQDIVSIGSLWLDAYSAIAEDDRIEGIGTTKFTEQACYLVVRIFLFLAVPLFVCVFFYLRLL